MITAGRVGNMEARLGTNGFDVVAIADTEEELVVALSVDDPDAIVVEADLCESLEHVRELAPHAVLIVVGDHTPAGALGRLETGVSGTVMAGLLHALVAEGVGGAMVWGFLPAVRSPRPVSIPEHVSGTLLSAKVVTAGTHIAHAVHQHNGLLAAAGTVVVTASASVLLTLGAPWHEGPEAARGPERVVEMATHDPTGGTGKPIGAPVARGSTIEPGDRATLLAAARSVEDDSLDVPPRNLGQPLDETPAPDETLPDTSPPAEETPPPHDAPPPPANDATLPPGVATGWGEQRPPKNDDNGNHTGWSNNSVPDDPSSASAGRGPGEETAAYGSHADSVTENPDAATATADA